MHLSAWNNIELVLDSRSGVVGAVGDKESLDKRSILRNDIVTAIRRFQHLWTDENNVYPVANDESCELLSEHSMHEDIDNIRQLNIVQLKSTVT